MSDTLLKLRILWFLLRSAIPQWREAVRDLDARMCCDGYECGCQGSTWRHFWEFETKRAPK